MQNEPNSTMPFRIDTEAMPPLDSSWPIKRIQSFIASNVGRDYAKFHSPRYAHLIHVLGKHLHGVEKRILDIGASELTDLIRHAFSTKVDVLDYLPDVKSEIGDLYFFDLNTVDRPNVWRKDLPTYDVVVMAEVFEHLYASPESIFRFLSVLLKPGGCLVLQTPNGIALRRRIMMLIGRHPFKPIRDGDKFGSHVREYTLKELRHYAESGGFEVVSAAFGSYFDVRYADNRSPMKTFLKRVFYALTLPTMRPGITMILKKSS